MQKATSEEKKEVEQKEVASLWSRRGFFALAGWAVFLGTVGAYLWRLFGTTSGFFFPKVLYEPSKIFAVGYPNDFPDHAVVTLKARRVFVVREGNGYQAISMVCQHLGCAVHWTEEKGIFECPCHGSKYYKDGVNFAGPAPRPLYHFQMNLADDGKLVVDTSTIIEREKKLLI
ncbi:MAG TPA: ubiquinol-cytochrome c reductase iron-sulfur subunit [Candidatus Hypogeohydataceae bacterium YC41]